MRERGGRHKPQVVGIKAENMSGALIALLSLLKFLSKYLSELKLYFGPGSYYVPINNIITVIMRTIATFCYMQRNWPLRLQRVL